MSGWYGEVPEHWHRARVKSVAERVTDGAHISPDTENGLYDFVSTRDVKGGVIDFTGALKTSQDTYEYMVKTGCRPNPGDVLFSKDGTVGETAIVTERRDFVVASSLVIITPIQGVMTSSYLAYVFASTPAREQASSLMRGAGLPRLSVGNLARLELFVPPLSEQRAIADYLDRETARIDTLIEEQQRLIEMLWERRRAVCLTAVTRGVDQGVELVEPADSAIGLMPAHWALRAVRHWLVSLDGFRIPLSAEERGERQGAFDYYGASGVIDHVDAFLFDEPLVLVSEDGANLLARSTPIAFAAKGRYWVNNHAHVLRPIDGDVDFWASRLEALDVSPVVSGSAQPKLTAGALMALRVSAPTDINEQRRIATYLGEQTAKIDTLIEESERFIDLARERRSALITAAVTGQIDAREMA